MPYNGKYPRKGRGFPRRSMNITPEEYLDDPNRILESPDSSTVHIPGKMTVLHQPRLETTQDRETRTQRQYVPQTAVPYYKQPTYIQPSRDAETFFVTNYVEVPPTTPTTLLQFTTFEALRTIIRWIRIDICDGLFPTQMGISVQVSGEQIKSIAQPNFIGPTGLGQHPQSPGFADMATMPDGFQNILLEIFERKIVEVVAINGTIATRPVSASLWGWLEPYNKFDDSVLR